MRILILNPNSSETMTAAVAQSLRGHSGRSELTFATGPPECPAEINGPQTATQSVKGCWKLLGDRSSKLYHGNFDGIVIACFSDHPVVEKLREAGGPPCCALLPACVAHLTLLGRAPPFSIVTSSQEWVAPLDQSVLELCAPRSRDAWRGTVAAQLTPLQIGRDVVEQVAATVRARNVRELGSRTVVLGCAGFSGVYKELQELLQGEALLVEPVQVAVACIESAIGYGSV